MKSLIYMVLLVMPSCLWRTGILDVCYKTEMKRRFYLLVKKKVYKIKKKGGEKANIISLVEIGIAGSMAGSVMAFLNCPIELLKVKLQTQDPKGIIAANGKHEPAVSCFFLKKKVAILIFIFAV